MAQISLFDEPLPYKYIFDASSIFSQKSDEPHRRNVYRSQWDKIDLLVREQMIVTCSEIKDEIKDKEIIAWIHTNRCIILDIDDEIQKIVIEIVTNYPKLIEFEKNKSSGDVFLIATAKKYGLTVITEENKTKPYKIPKVCEAMNVQCFNVTELCVIEGWYF